MHIQLARRMLRNCAKKLIGIGFHDGASVRHVCFHLSSPREHPPGTDYVQQVASGALTGVVSSLTIVELYASEKLSEEEKRIVDSSIKPLQIIDVRSDISLQAGWLVRQWRRSYGIGVIDAVIAATALIEEVPVLTLNAQHFNFIGLSSIRKTMSGILSSLPRDG